MKKNSSLTLGLIFGLQLAIVSLSKIHMLSLYRSVAVTYIVSGESNLRKLKEATDDIPVRVSWPGAKLFLGGSPDQREKFKNIVHQCLV